MATLNNGLQTIELGSINWRTLFNSNMQKLDISTINFVLHSELPTTFLGDRMYFTTDTTKFFFDNGTEILEIVGGIIKGLDADKLTKTVDQDLYYSTDTNLIWFNSNGTMIQVTGSADFSEISEDIVPKTNNDFDLGKDDKGWNSLYTRRTFSDKFYTLYPYIDMTFDVNTTKKFKFTGDGRLILSMNKDTFEVTPYGNISFATAGNISLNGNGNIDFKTGFTTRLQVSQNLINITEFTSLGDLSPNIKIKKITGTTGSSQGDTVSVLHNLTGSKIISFTLKIEQNTDEGVSEEHTFTSGFQSSIHHTDTNFIISNSLANSGSILSKPFTILVTYEA